MGQRKNRSLGHAPKHCGMFLTEKDNSDFMYSFGVFSFMVDERIVVFRNILVVIEGGGGTPNKHPFEFAAAC